MIGQSRLTTQLGEEPDDGLLDELVLGESVGAHGAPSARPFSNSAMLGTAPTSDFGRVSTSFVT